MELVIQPRLEPVAYERCEECGRLIDPYASIYVGESTYCEPCAERKIEDWNDMIEVASKELEMAYMKDDWTQVVLLAEKIADLSQMIAEAADEIRGT